MKPVYKQRPDMHVYYLYPIQAYLNWTIDSLISCKTVYQLKVETMSESCFWCHRNSREEKERSQNELHRNTASRPLLILCRCQPMGAAPRGRAQPPIGTRGALRWSQTQVWGGDPQFEGDSARSRNCAGAEAEDKWRRKPSPVKNSRRWRSENRR